MEDERLITSTMQFDDNEVENVLRPNTMSAFVGQDKIKSNLEIYIQAAKSRGEALDHVLLYGPPGLGKTTLAHIIAAEMNSRLTVTSGPAIEKPADLAAILTNLEKKRRIVYRRDSQAQSLCGRDTLSGDGRLRSRFYCGQGAEREERKDFHKPVYACGRHDEGRQTHFSAQGQIRCARQTRTV